MPVCHAGQLLQLGCHVEEGSNKRVCTSCLVQYAEGLPVPGTRCRLLPQPLGLFHGARNFYLKWSIGASTVDGVRPLKIRLNDTFGNRMEDAQLLVFIDEATAVACEQALPPGQLLRIAEESVTLRLCAGSKSFCPVGNFDSSTAKTCHVHIAWVAGGKRPRANSDCSSSSSSSSSNAPVPAAAAGPAPLPGDNLFSARNGDEEPTFGPSGAPACGGGGGGDGGGEGQPLPSDTSSVSFQSAVSVESLGVSGRLFAHGETLKAGGSSQWTVVSDARLKDVVATFDLGAGEVLKLRPKVFKYKEGLSVGGGDAGREYVGLLAQEVPDALAPYCRRRVWLKLRPEDAVETEIFMLDPSVLPFLCINAIQDVDRELAALSVAVAEQAAATATRVEVEKATDDQRAWLRRPTHRARLAAAVAQLRGLRQGTKLALLAGFVASAVGSLSRAAGAIPAADAIPWAPLSVVAGLVATSAAYVTGGEKAAAPVFLVAALLVPSIVGFFAFSLRPVDFLLAQTYIGASELFPIPRQLALGRHAAPGYAGVAQHARGDGQRFPRHHTERLRRDVPALARCLHRHGSADAGTAAVHDGAFRRGLCWRRRSC